MWDFVQDRIKRRYNNTYDVLIDIIDGKYYKEYCGKGNFLEKDINLSMLFNIDGVLLFQFLGILLWLVFFVINEILLIERLVLNLVICIFSVQMFFKEISIYIYICMYKQLYINNNILIYFMVIIVIYI